MRTTVIHIVINWIRPAGYWGLQHDEIRKMLDADRDVKSGRLVYKMYPWLGLPGGRLP